MQKIIQEHTVYPRFKNIIPKNDYKIALRRIMKTTIINFVIAGIAALLLYPHGAGSVEDFRAAGFVFIVAPIFIIGAPLVFGKIYTMYGIYETYVRRSIALMYVSVYIMWLFLTLVAPMLYDYQSLHYKVKEIVNISIVFLLPAVWQGLLVWGSMRFFPIVADTNKKAKRK